ncbi:MAG: type IX secretion system membrane protein PorP/SprF [Elusimicrobiota bacterium]
MKIINILKIIGQRKLRVLAVILLPSSIFLLPSNAQSAFKDIGFSVRPAGMGNAFVAVCNDYNASNYNPAGISVMTKKELGFAYTKPYMGLENVNLSMMYLSYVHPMSAKIGNMGITITSFDGDGLYAENMFSLSYARSLYSKKDSKYCVGVNVKYLSHVFNWDERTKLVAEQVDDPVVKAGNSKGAASADVGFLAVFSRKFSLGVAAKNINQPDLGLKYEDRVPTETRLGVAYKIPYWKGMDTVVGTVDVSYRAQEWGKEADKTNVHAGVETWFATHKYAVRIGGNKNEVTTGFGINRRLGQNFSIQIDYALMWSLRIADNSGSHRLGASVKF